MKKALKTKYFAFLCTDNQRSTVSFTTHFSKFAAEKHYGDLSRHYKGSSNSDYTLAVYTKEELEKELLKDYIIDYKKCTLTLRDEPLKDAEGGQPMKRRASGWYYSSDLDGSEIHYFEDEPTTSESYNYTGPFETFHAAKIDAIAYHTTNKNTAVGAIKHLKAMRKRNIERK